ncbi:MAG: ABC-F family ATP-binding cassette domain-containing protein [Acidobacteriota bacterium]|nr:MAG: ABC-F family ATP-binding cassette domain-containing protein [Acidobacteriota bacterium]
MLFKFENLGKEFTGEWLFRHLSAQCNVGERIGLIGRNGAGKTTLINLLDGSLHCDEGQIVKAARLTISRVDQIARLQPDKTVYEEAVSVNAEVIAIEAELRELEHVMSEGRIEEETAHRYEELKSIFELHGGYEHEARTEKVLHGVGFGNEDFKLLCSQLSGGQRSRLLLARVLLKPAELLLLDEPTNHLDLSAILWLENYLKMVPAAVLIISHDRHFLDAVTARTWEVEGGRLFDYPFSYTRSRKQRAQRIERELKDFEEQQEWKRQTEDYIRRNIVGQKTKQAQARRKQLEKTVWLEAPVYSEVFPRIEIPEAVRGGAIVLESREGVVGFESKRLVHSLDLTFYRGDRVGILGGNGSGKTTLLRTLLGEQSLLEGQIRWGYNNVVAYYAQESGLEDPDRSVLDILAEISPSATDEELRKFAARFLFRGDEIFKQGSHLSGGERSRLAFARLFAQPSNVLFLDEPTNHLDIDSREALEAGLQGYSGSLVIVSHDLYFLKQVASRFFLIRQERLVELSDLDNLADELLQKADTQRRPPKENSRKREGSLSQLSKNERMRAEKRREGIENEIEGLEALRSEIEGRMSAGNGDHEMLANLSQEYAEIDRKLAGLYAQWEEVSHLLESE